MDDSCAPRKVRGWEVVVDSSQQRWTYRSDRAGQRLYLLDSDATEVSRIGFSDAIAQKVLAIASPQVQEPIDNLHVLAVQSATWDGCMGITAPGQACTQNVMSGFKVLIGSEPRAIGVAAGQETDNTKPEDVPKEWVYHVSEDGSQIVQNAAASNTKPLVNARLMRSSAQTLDWGADIFHLETDHIYGGMRSAVTLAADGTVYYELFSDLIPEQSRPKTAISQLSPEDVTEVQALFEQQQFSNFDRMLYTTEDPTNSADGDKMLTAAGASVGFYAEVENLPERLQPVVAEAVEIAVQTERRVSATMTD